MARFQGEAVDQEPRKPRFAGEVPTPTSPEELSKADKFQVEPERVPAAAAFGTALGAVAPEILSFGVAPAAAAFPLTAPAAPYLFATGRALRGQRLASALGTGITSGAGEAVRQATGALGGGPTAREVAGLATEVAGPGVTKFVARRVPYIGEAMETAEKRVRDIATERLARDISAGKGGREPFETVYGALEAESRNIMQTAQSKANQVLMQGRAQANALRGTNQAEAQRIEQAANTEAQNIINDAQRQVDFARAARSRAAGAEQKRIGEPPVALAQVGQRDTETNIGTRLRNEIVKNQSDLIAQRTQNKNKLLGEIATEVNEKQAKNQFVQDEPIYKAMLEKLKERAGIGPYATSTKREVDPPFLRFLTNEYNTLSKGGMQVEKAGVAQPFPKIPFDALDTIRRRYADIAFNRNAPAEGYDANVRLAAQELYSELSKAMSNFSKSKGQFTKQYEADSSALNVFGTKAGKRGSAVERFDDERYVTNAADLPASYFKNAGTVADLIELTGNNTTLVAQEGAKFAARSLEGKSANAARNWARENEEWLSKLALTDRVNNYVSTLERTERQLPRISRLGEQFRTTIQTLPIKAGEQAAKVTEAGKREAESVVRKGETEAERIVLGAEREAGKMTAEGEAAARKLLTEKDPAAYIAQLITKGDTEQLRLVAPIIARNANAKKAFGDAIDITLSRVLQEQQRTPLQARKVTDEYNQFIRPALEKAGLLSREQADRLAKQTQYIDIVTNPTEKNLLMREFSLAVKNVLAGQAAANLGGTSLTKTLGGMGLSALGL